MAKRKTGTTKELREDIKRATESANNEVTVNVQEQTQMLDNKAVETKLKDAVESKQQLNNAVRVTSPIKGTFVEKQEATTHYVEKQEAATHYVKMQEGATQIGMVATVTVTEYNKLKKEKETLETNLKKVTEELNKVKEDYEALKKIQSASAETLQKQVSQLVTDRKAMQDELKLQKARLSSSFTSQELANCLNDAIADFNNKISEASEKVSYSIGSMDVNLKAQIVKQNDKLGFITTSTAGEAALSDIRFTIAATPRD